MELVGSYIKKEDGTLEKNLEDEAMAQRKIIEAEKANQSINNTGAEENVTSEK